MVPSHTSHACERILLKTFAGLRVIAAINNALTGYMKSAVPVYPCAVDAIIMIQNIERGISHILNLYTPS